METLLQPVAAAIVTHPHTPSHSGCQTNMRVRLLVGINKPSRWCARVCVCACVRPFVTSYFVALLERLIWPSGLLTPRQRDWLQYQCCTWTHKKTPQKSRADTHTRTCTGVRARKMTQTQTGTSMCFSFLFFFFLALQQEVCTCSN